MRMPKLFTMRPLVCSVPTGVGMLILAILEQLSVPEMDGKINDAVQLVVLVVLAVMLGGQLIMGPWSSFILMICVPFFTVPVHQSATVQVRIILYIPSQIGMVMSLKVKPKPHVPPLDISPFANIG